VIDRLDIRVAGEGDADRWDAFVSASPDSQIAHLAGWRSVVERVQRQRYLGLAAVDARGNWQGVLPAVLMKTPFLGSVAISMPYLNYGGPIGSAAARKQLADALIERAARGGATEVEFRTRHTPLEHLRPARPKVIVTLGLDAGADAVWGSFPAKLRSQIRRPQKEGMEFKIGHDQLPSFYTVFARNMRDLGTPVYSSRFFEAIRDTFPQAHFAALYLGAVPVGAACGFIWNGEFEITWASTVRDYNRLSPNMLLYWELMRHMAELGVRTFNFGRSTPDTGPHRFKMQWGSVEHPLPWTTWSAHRLDGDNDGKGRLKHLAAEAWKRLPMRVANALGPVIAPRLPWW
jgi:FemAB-related protein (PEP-CTERM system-associated)